MGESAPRERRPGIRIELFRHGGLLVVATNPRCADTNENQQRLLQLDAALDAAFLSREATPKGKRAPLATFSAGGPADRTSLESLERQSPRFPSDARHKLSADFVESRWTVMLSDLLHSTGGPGAKPE